MDAYEGDRPPTILEMERRHILNVLRFTQGNKVRAATLLGICLKTLYNKLNRYEESGLMEFRT